MFIKHFTSTCTCSYIKYSIMFPFLEPEICQIQEINDVSGVCSFELAADQQKELNK